ncbi:MAG: hypothetical protein LW870_25515 [Pirellula sp.]|nr:hypothetical protein [Pirellula sp.]
MSDSGVAGVDVTVPAFEFSVRKKFEFVSTEYLLAMVAMTGRVNSTGWSIRSTRFLVDPSAQADASLQTHHTNPFEVMGICQRTAFHWWLLATLRQ